MSAIKRLNIEPQRGQMTAIMEIKRNASLLWGAWNNEIADTSVFTPHTHVRTFGSPEVGPCLLKRLIQGPVLCPYTKCGNHSKYGYCYIDYKPSRPVLTKTTVAIGLICVCPCGISICTVLAFHFASQEN